MHVGGVVFKLKEMLDAAALPFYFLTGRRPWSPGYYTKKKLLIEYAIDECAVQIDRPIPAKTMADSGRSRMREVYSKERQWDLFRSLVSGL